MSANITNNKLLNYLDRLNGDYRPITADVFITNFCNNLCPYCTYRRWELDSEAISMSFEDFKKYIDILISLGVQGIILTGGGEPTLNKDFNKITKYLEENNIHYGINTNFNELRFFNPDYLKVSLDGYDEESYKKLRGVEKYYQTRDNIKKYLDWKKTQTKKTSVGIQKIITNNSDILKFYEANKDLEVDYIVFRPIESTLGQYYKDKKNYDTVPEAIRTINYLSKIDNRVLLNYKWEEITTKFDKCYAHWSQIALNEKGEVIYCCHKPYEIIGHITEKNILEKYHRSATDISKCDVPCRLTAPNKLVKSINTNPINKEFI